jgi:hypothetical protein
MIPRLPCFLKLFTSEPAWATMTFDTDTSAFVEPAVNKRHPAINEDTKKAMLAMRINLFKITHLNCHSPDCRELEPQIGLISPYRQS